MLKRKIFLGWIALELAALPAAAHIFSKVNFQLPQRVTAVEVASEPGNITFMVNSNAPFVVITEGGVTDFEVYVSDSGKINGNVYGENAQLPGKSFICAKTNTTTPNAIYFAERETEVRKGPILTRAIRVDIAYDPALNPKLDIISENEAQGLTRAPACEKEV